MDTCSQLLSFVQLCDPTNYSPPCSSVHGILLGKHTPICWLSQKTKGLGGYNQLPNKIIMPSSKEFGTYKWVCPVILSKKQGKGISRSWSLLLMFSCSVVSDSFETPWIVALQGSSVHGNSQAWSVDWVAISFSRGLSWTRDQTCLLHWQMNSLLLNH